MNLQNYIKFRCDLNNLNYKEIPFVRFSSQPGDSPNKNVKIIKEIKDQDDQVKYIVTYYLYDYSDRYTNEEDADQQFRINVNACFYIYRSDTIIKRDSIIKLEPYVKKNYDNINMTYMLSDYRNPSEVEEIFEKFWISQNSFVNDPYKVII